MIIYNGKWTSKHRSPKNTSHCSLFELFHTTINIITSGFFSITTSTIHKKYSFQLGMVGFLATSWVLFPNKKNGAVSLFHWGHFAVDSSKGSGGFIPQVTASAVVRTVVWKLISNINKRRKTFLAIPSIIVEFWRESKWNGSNTCNSSVFVD